jgi:peptide subunit release factor RF-3
MHTLTHRAHSRALAGTQLNLLDTPGHADFSEDSFVSG